MTPETAQPSDRNDASGAPRQVVLRDTTLREGIQIPGSAIPEERKSEFVALLEEIGVQEIEIGLPDGMTACAELAQLIRSRGYAIKASGLVPCYTSRWQRQVDMAVEHGVHRIDILTPVSDHLLKDPSHYGMRPEDIPARLEQVIAYARGTSLELAVGCMDATRTPMQRLATIVQPLQGLGVSRLTVYDSVGVMLPTRMVDFVSEIRRASGLPVLVHCHNDYGMATANSLAAVEGGASAVDVAVNGLGGRAGNAALEEVAMALENLCSLGAGVKTERLRELSNFTQQMTGLDNSPLKPIVGRFCFAHLPVMHIRCIAGGNPAAFEPFDPQQVGAERTYGFSLPVDYAAALGPFIAKSGCTLGANQIACLLSKLRERNDFEGWTEQQILQLIDELHRTTGARQ